MSNTDQCWQTFATTGCPTAYMKYRSVAMPPTHTVPDTAQNILHSTTHTPSYLPHEHI